MKEQYEIQINTSYKSGVSEKRFDKIAMLDERQFLALCRAMLDAITTLTEVKEI